MLQISLFDQVLEMIRRRAPFTLYPFFIGNYQPKGQVVHTIDESDVGQLGYILQWWAKLAIYGNKTISFNPTPKGIEIIYENNLPAGATRDERLV